MCGTIKPDRANNSKIREDLRTAELFTTLERRRLQQKSTLGKLRERVLREYQRHRVWRKRKKIEGLCFGHGKDGWTKHRRGLRWVLEVIRMSTDPTLNGNDNRRERRVTWSVMSSDGTVKVGRCNQTGINTPFGLNNYTNVWRIN